MAVQSLAIDLLKTDGTQTRAALDETTLGEYAAVWKNGAEFPPCVVFHDGFDYWVGGGHHRVEAARRAGRASVPCIVKSGQKRDAIEFGFRDNDTHGLRRSNADKRYAVNMALDDKAWGKLSSVKIAELIGVAESLVRKMREERETKESPDSGVRTKRTPPPSDTKDEPKAETRTGKDGKEQPAKKTKPKPVPAVAAVEEETEPEADRPAVDELGDELPDHLCSVFAAAKEFAAKAKELSAVAKWIEETCKTKAGRKLLKSRPQALTDIGNLKNAIKFSAPYAICPYCKANKKHCDACEGSGWVSKDVYNQAPPEKKKKGA